jgi:hypothetical protein
MTDAWKDTHVAGWVSLAGPFAGATQLFMVQVAGDKSLLGGAVAFVPGISAHAVRDMMSNWGVGAFMAPRPTSNRTANEAPIVYVAGRAYTTAAVRDVLQLAADKQTRGDDVEDCVFCAHMDADSALRTLEVFDYEYADGDTTGPPGVDMWCLHSTGVPTITGFDYETEDLSDEPSIRMQPDGDGTVHGPSLRVCDTWGAGRDEDRAAILGTIICCP